MRQESPLLSIFFHPSADFPRVVSFMVRKEIAGEDKVSWPVGSDGQGALCRCPMVQRPFYRPKEHISGSGASVQKGTASAQTLIQ